MEVSPRIADLAFDAYRRYAKGTGSLSSTELRRLLSYALAKHLAAPLLFKGDDFSRTDIQAAANVRTGEPRPADFGYPAAECSSRRRPVAPTGLAP